MTCEAWTALQAIADRLLARRPTNDALDVRDPLIDLTTCPTCGTDLTLEKTG